MIVLLAAALLVVVVVVTAQALGIAIAGLAHFREGRRIKKMQRRGYAEPPSGVNIIDPTPPVDWELLGWDGEDELEI